MGRSNKFEIYARMPLFYIPSCKYYLKLNKKLKKENIFFSLKRELDPSLIGGTLILTYYT